MIEQVPKPTFNPAAEEIKSTHTEQKVSMYTAERDRGGGMYRQTKKGWKATKGSVGKNVCLFCSSLTGSRECHVVTASVGL